MLLGYEQIARGLGTRGSWGDVTDHTLSHLASQSKHAFLIGLRDYLVMPIPS